MKNKKASKNKTKNRKLPKWLQPVLWSYDVSKMNTEKDKGLIIEQVLNYGTDEELEWLIKIYRDKDIKKIILYPSRGNWFPEVLNYWLAILNIKLDRDDYELAIRDLCPLPKRRKLIWRLLSKRINASKNKI